MMVVAVITAMLAVLPGALVEVPHPPVRSMGSWT